MSEAGVAIVGAGHAAFNLALALSTENLSFPITIFGDENHLPYHRPPLSKTYVKGGMDDGKIWLRPQSWYDEVGISLKLDERVNAIDRHNKTLETSEGTLPYQKLVLATGTKARTLPIPGCNLEGVELLRTLNDARQIRDRLPECKSVVIVGGGFIGMEFASAARALGKSVTVLEATPRILGRSVAPQVSAFAQDQHRLEGIQICLNARIREFVGQDGKVCGVVCDDEKRYEADMVVVGIGVDPVTELAENAGLECSNGICVDQQMRTSDEDIFAIGDCAAHVSQYAKDRRVRVESIQNATDQARFLAKIISGSEPDAKYNSVPWFWSDQGNLKLQMVGLSYDADEYVLRGDPDQARFSVFHYCKGKLIAVDSVNQAADHMAGRKLIENEISPSKEQIEDLSLRLKDLIRR